MVGTPAATAAGNNPTNSPATPTSLTVTTGNTFLLKLNGHERFSARKASYFRVVQPYQHHTCAPSRHIHVYSFALKPEEHQPSGTCNFSRIDVSSMDLTFDNEIALIPGTQLVFYTINYNIFRIASGLGGKWLELCVQSSPGSGFR